jgi:5-methylcytosine-specific restriction endonuclease McrA
MTPEYRAALSARWTEERRRQASLDKGGTGKPGAKVRRKREQRIQAQRGKPFRPLDVFEADDYICRLCGEPCERDKVAPGGRSSGRPVSIWAPTIDHIVPLSKGGLHCRDNVQTAHFRCNCRKTDRLAA